MMTLVFIGSNRKHGFQHQVLAQDVAAQAAVAVENSRLYQQARNQEEALRQLNAELEQRVYERTAQLPAVNRELEAFSYSVSHDLRAPLRAIDGFSQALLEDYSAALDKQGQDYLRRVRAATQRMGDLIDDMLALSRVTRQEMDYQAVDLNQLAHDIIELYQQSEPERRVEVKIAEHLVTQGDERLLAILLQNLIGNAWKFTSKRELAKIEIGKTEHDGQPYFFVRDNGAGFDSANVGRLFGAFQRLHHAQDFDGTGIGLATAQRIINRHGGHIFAHGEVDQGAVFYFTLKTPAITTTTTE
jgi:light-regulated signal transduction histidine kinase (bacteriophytochrome)